MRGWFVLCHLPEVVGRKVSEVGDFEGGGGEGLVRAVSSTGVGGEEGFAGGGLRFAAKRALGGGGGNRLLLLEFRVAREPNGGDLLGDGGGGLFLVLLEAEIGVFTVPTTSRDNSDAMASFVAVPAVAISSASAW